MLNFAQNYLLRGFWGDEAWTSLISQLPYTQMLKTTAADFHPPGYYTIIELIYKIMPMNELATRMVSIFFWWLTIWMVFLLARKFKGQNFGLISALVVAVNPIFFTYAFEARNYTMFAFSATSSIYFLLKVLEKFNRKNALLYLVFSTLGIYTHYYMFFVMAAEGIFVLLIERKNFWKMVAIWAVMFAFYLPWIPLLFKQVTSVGQSYWIGGINSRTHYEALERILTGEDYTMFRPFLFWLSILLIVVGIWHHFIRKKFEKAYLLIWLWAVIPFILASLPGLKISETSHLPFRPIFFWRYLIGASVPLALLIVHGAQRLNINFYRAAIAAVVVLSLSVDFITWNKFPPTFKQVYAQSVIPNILTEDKIVTVLPSFAEVLYYRNYFGLKNEVIVLPEGLVQFSGKSLLDTYSADGIVKVEEAPMAGKYYLMTRDNNNNPVAKYVVGDK